MTRDRAYRPQRIALATSEMQQNLTDEDRILMGHLEEAGFAVEPFVWTRGTECGESLVIIRSCWNYHLQPARFLEWIEAVSRNGGKVLNPPSTIRWNHDKRYLRDLEAKGVHIAPTVWVEPATKTSLKKITKDNRWMEIVVKPAISATSWRTFRTSVHDVDRFESRFQALLRSGCVLVQKFVPEVLTKGEWSFLFFNGTYSHAVLKRPAQSDFRVQPQFGGTIDLQAQANCQLISDASRALELTNMPTLYARVDGIETADGLIIMEVELIEPALFLRYDEQATARFAQAIADQRHLY